MDLYISLSRSQLSGSQERGDKEFHNTEDFTWKRGIQRTEEHTELHLHMIFKNRQETWGRTQYK